MTLFAEPKIDCHNHILDPLRFPYAPDTHYRPTGHEIATAAQFTQVLETYGVQHALLVGPNSGYGLDNRCMLDAIAHGDGRFKGIAVVRNDCSEAELIALKHAGIVGVAFNIALLGEAFYADTAPLLARLKALDLFVQVQTEHDQLVSLLPMLVESGVRILVDHCGRPTISAGLQQAGFQALLSLAKHGRTVVKLSGLIKFSEQAYPHDDAQPYVRALIDTFTPAACVWASDWPFLRANARVDYGLMLTQMQRWFPVADDRRQVFWDTPRRLFGFA